MLNHKFTICIDMDDTIENLVEAWVTFLNNKHGYNLKNEDITDWDMSKAYPNLSKAELYEPLTIPEFWDTVKPKADAIEYMWKLFDDGHDLYILTNTKYSLLKEKVERILLKYFPMIDCNHKLITASKKQMINCDIMIDDGHHNLIGGNYWKILIDTPHNRDVNDMLNGLHRVKNWSEVYQEIQKIDAIQSQLDRR